MKPDPRSPIAVQCDFDDTVILDNMSHAILETFASGDWRSIEVQYHSGEFSVERSNQLVWPMVRASREQIRAFVRDRARVRTGFADFAEYCTKLDIRLVVVSNGLDVYLEPVLASLGLAGLERFCGKAVFTSDGIELLYSDPLGVERREGFKLACQQYLRCSADYLVYIGDGASDVAPALRADLVLARSTLAEELRARGRPFATFETFHDVTRALQESRGGRLKSPEQLSQQRRARLEELEELEGSQTVL